MRKINISDVGVRIIDSNKNLSINVILKENKN